MPFYHVNRGLSRAFQEGMTKRDGRKTREIGAAVTHFILTCARLPFMRQNNWTWVALFLLGLAALVLFLMNRFPEALESEDRQMRLVYSLLLLTFVGGSLILGWRERAGVALKQALDVVAPMGRVSLLGCTRVSDTPIDYYQKVHRPGVEIIGAHTNARPVHESYTHHWTHRDDIVALMDLVAGGRIDMSKMLSEIHAPEDAPAVFRRLAENKDFPIGVAFRWK